MSERDQRSGQGEEGAVHVAMAFVAQPQATELMEPADGPLDDPAVAAQAAAMAGAAFGQERFDGLGLEPGAKGRAIVRPVGIKPGDLGPQAAGQPGEQGEEIAGVVVVGWRDQGDQRHPGGIGQDMVLGAGLGPVRGIGSRLAPPKTARTELESTATRDQLTRPARSNRSTSTACSRSQTPAASHSRIRRQQVMPLPQPSSCGKSSQPMPVFNTNTIPVSAARSGSRLRPGKRRRRGRGGISGSMIAHSLSSISGLAMPPLTRRAARFNHFVRRS